MKANLDACLTRPSHVRSLLATLDLHPSKALGQNFLVDRNILDVLLQAAAIGGMDSVLEVGPGLGVLTERLLAAGAAVTAVETDSRLVAHLRARFAHEKRLRLLHADMLDLDAEEMLAGTDCVVSNLPYAAGTRIMMDLILAQRAPRSFTVTLQREVAARLAATAGSHAYGLISVWAAVKYDVRVVRQVPAACFWPQPEVVSSIVDLRRRSGPPLDARTVRDLCRWTRLGFQHRRKQLLAALTRQDDDQVSSREAVAAALRYVGAEPKARAENLAPDQWVELTRRLA